jgi:hypothetical protein
MIAIDVTAFVTWLKNQPQKKQDDDCKDNPEPHDIS